MSTLASEALGSSVTGDITSSSSTLVPTVTRIDARAEVNPVSVVLAVSIVFILAPITISSNTMILAAFYRYKRLRTASNCLLASLAVSDFGVGVFMPFGMHLELSGLPDDAEVSTLCIIPYCIVIALCSVSVLVTVAIAVDRLTSLAQPLRYKNIITHSSVEKYIAVFWLYAIGVGLSPLIYAQIMGFTQPHSGNCRFGAAVVEPVRVFLVVAVWAPSALVLLGCYMYVYLVARAHARAIYTVELSFRHQTQTLALPRYGQTLAVTVGAFLVLWLPFQACMLLDIFCGTKILSEWAVVWLGLPILAHSGANPWIYAFHHGEMRVAATKIAEDVVTRFGIHPSRYGCSPVRRGSNTNLELAEVNKSNEARRPPVEDCFAAKHQNSFYPRERASPRCEGSNNTDISPEGADSRRRFSDGSVTAEIVEEDIHDLTKMLRPEYAIDRNHLIDSNHNIDKIKNLKYLLDPTFNKIRHLRRLNHKRPCLKTLARFDESKFISYQNLKSEQSSNGKTLQLNAMSDPVLNAESAGAEDEDLSEVLCGDPVLCRRRNSNLTSMSDPNIKSVTGNVASASSKVIAGREVTPEVHGCSVQSLDNARYEHSLARHRLQCRRIDYLKKSNFRGCGKSLFRNSVLDDNRRDLQIREMSKISERLSPDCKAPPMRQINLTTNKLANLLNPDDQKFLSLRESRVEASSRLGQPRLNLESLRHSESISAIERASRSRLLEPSRFMENLTVPTIHSEPPSPVEPRALDSLKNPEEPLRIYPQACRTSSSGNCESSFTPQRRYGAGSSLPSPARLSDPVIPFVLLSVENCGSPSGNGQDSSYRPCGRTDDTLPNVSSSIVPEELAEALLMSSERSSERRPSGTIFTEHDSTRFSSRRPSDLRWSESSRSQEVLSNVNERQKSPSSYSVNNFDSCTSGSDLNDVTCLGSFMCPDPLTSSLRESFFEAPSVPDSDVFTSFEDLENRDVSPQPNSKPWQQPMVHFSVSSVNLERAKVSTDVDNNQSKSSESVLKNQHAILRLESSVHRSRFRVRPGKDCILKDPLLKKNIRIAPLATPTPMDICTPTFDTAAEIKGASGVGVRV